MSDNDKPRLTQRFITALDRLNVTANGSTHEGSMPDVVIPLTVLDSETLAEIRGMTVNIPEQQIFGRLITVTHDDSDFTIELDTGSHRVPGETEVHVTGRSWSEAGMPALERNMGENSALRAGDQRS